MTLHIIRRVRPATGAVFLLFLPLLILSALAGTARAQTGGAKASEEQPARWYGGVVTYRERMAAVQAQLDGLERREAGVFNLGGPGSITVDGEKYDLGFQDCLYITMGAKEVIFASADGSAPARFYLVSAPAHKSYKTTFLSMADAAKRPCGAAETANARVINQFIHPDVLPTCQLSMGLTQLSPGSVWNTMPAHTHERRMEIYTYFNIPEGNVVFHMRGQGQETRHIVMQNYEAVISPSWSIHCGCGTGSYTFIWAMGGENQAFDDMDNIPITELR